ncbi:hypothetical protein [Sulfurimonas sp. HSL-1716]|uniref:hypothetical protein n=1 Tax=Hydrocurvibacter sulfurireducens TaxID=3131937 RepID=UPI0031F9DDC6
MQRRDNLVRLFHIAIIALLSLNMFGCGYKAAPYYEDDNTTVKPVKTLKRIEVDCK